jgi:hypothetical protein
VTRAVRVHRGDDTVVARERQPGAQGGLSLHLLDLHLEALGQLLEPGLQGQDLVLLGGAVGDELGRRLPVYLQLHAAVLDVVPVGCDRTDGVDVAVAEALHHVELRHEVVEAARREQHVHDADVARLVDVLGARLELLGGDLEVVLGDVEQVLVLLDLLLHRRELTRSLVVLLGRDLGLVVDLVEPALDRLEAGLLLGDGRGGRRRRERERGDEETQKKGECDVSSGESGLQRRSSFRGRRLARRLRLPMGTAVGECSIRA